MNQSNKKSHISLLLLTHNEAKFIEKNFSWLNSCSTINEIIVVDDHSTDNTLSVVKKLQTKSLNVITHSRGLDGNFSAQRNFALTHCTNDWVLWLDPDETPSSKLIQFIQHFDFTSTADFAIKRHDTFLGKELRYGETSANTFVRIFNKKNGGFIGSVHETWTGNRKIAVLGDITINHTSAQTLDQFFSKINLYSSLRARELFQKQHPFKVVELIFFPVLKFIQNYFFRFGFLDGTPGIILALGMSFHSFLVRAKLWHYYHQ